MSYDPKNNDTYPDVLSMDPATDVEIHMFSSDKGRGKIGNHFGDFTVETRQIARNKVLQFASAKDIGLTLVKHLTLPTLFPLSLVNRYGIKEDAITYRQKTPVFFDSSSDCFVVLMDSRFLRDMEAKELSAVLSAHKKSIKIFKGKDGSQYLGCLYESVAKISSDSGPDEQFPFTAILDAYAQYVASIQGGTKVILVEYRHENQKVQLPFHQGLEMDPEYSPMASLSIIVSVAFAFDNRYYLSKDGQTIDRNRVVYLDKKTQQTGTSTEGKYRHLKDSEILVIPYSDEQYQFFMGLCQRLAMLNSELSGFLKKLKNPTQALDFEAKPDSSSPFRLLPEN